MARGALSTREALEDSIAIHCDPSFAAANIFWHAVAHGVVVLDNNPLGSNARAVSVARLASALLEGNWSLTVQDWLHTDWPKNAP